MLIVSYKENSPNHSGVADSIMFGNGKVFEIPGIDIRIGILKSVTNGMHDLFMGCDEILKWSGENYTQD